MNNEQAEWLMCWRIGQYSPIKYVCVVRCFDIVFTSLYYKSILQVLQLYWLVSQSQVICQKKRINHKLAHKIWASISLDNVDDGAWLPAPRAHYLLQRFNEAAGHLCLHVSWA